MVTLPPSVIVVFYLTAGLGVLITNRWDAQWTIAARAFLAVTMFSWAGFYTIIHLDLLSLEALRSLSRWLHLPTAVAIILMSLNRWYVATKERSGE